VTPINKYASYICKYILQGEPLYQPTVFVLCSPVTFSAAYHFMYYLSEIGKATIVGVPSSQAGNTFMEVTPFKLPHTGVEGSISNAVQILYPTNKEKGKILMPEYAMQWKDYLQYDFDEHAELLFILDKLMDEKN
ncbi:MAG: S41 family peptidase, partial [Tannerellaceae bacterium]|nr:S41 family peptidase [Tannerellaceae bacterium]